MSTSDILAAAEQLLAEILIKYSDSPLNASDMEDDLQRFLQVVQESPEERSGFAAMFIDMLSGRSRSPEWLVAYCMRALRWPEVRAAAETEIQKKLPLTLSDARDVLTAYEDEWTGSDLFTRMK